MYSWLHSIWECLHAHAFFATAELKCDADPPPATLVLSGELKHQSKCLGAYTLVAGRAAHGRPVWRHESGDKFIAKLANGDWAVQEEKDVGVNGDGFLWLSDANVLFPHQSRVELVAWEEADGTGGWPA